MAINTMSDVLGQSGEQLEWKDQDGKSYKLSLITLKSQSKIERIIESDAIESVKAHRELIGEDEYGRQIAKLLRDITQGKFIFGGELCQESLQTVRGVSALVSVIFNVDRDEAIALLRNEPDVKDVIKMVTERSFQKKVKPAQDQ
jgi:hypothetical protein